MKTIYLIGGTMGVGKTTISQLLKKELDKSVFLDGDWCWDMHPFQVTEETKTLVLDNICYLLNNFIHCSSYENIIFAWVMHEQTIIDEILARIDTEGCAVKLISLVCQSENLIERIKKDIDAGIRNVEVIERTLARLSCYDNLQTTKIDVSKKSPHSIMEQIKNL